MKISEKFKKLYKIAIGFNTIPRNIFYQNKSILNEPST